MSEETRRELRDEDEELCGQLEAILEAYEKAASNWSGPGSEEFWKRWWATLEPLLPENNLEGEDHELVARTIWFPGSYRDTYSKPKAHLEVVRRASWWRVESDADTVAWNSKAYGTRGTQHINSRMDLTAEIKQYFDGVFSDHSFKIPTPPRPGCRAAHWRRCPRIEGF